MKDYHERNADNREEAYASNPEPKKKRSSLGMPPILSLRTRRNNVGMPPILSLRKR